MVNYPTSLDNDTTLYLVVDNVDDYMAAHHNSLKDAIIAVQTALGITGNFNFTTDSEFSAHTGAGNPHSTSASDTDLSNHAGATATHGVAQIANHAEIASQILTHKNIGTAHHTPPVAGDFSHNSLADINAGDAYEHITQTQKNALHAETHVLATTGPHTGTLPLADLAVGSAGSIIRRGAADWEELAKADDGDVLTLTSGYPVWETPSDYDPDLMIGSANAAWIPCVYEIPSELDKLKNAGFNIYNYATGNTYALWNLPIPTNRGGLKLYLAESAVGLGNANGTNYVDTRIVGGTITGSGSNIDTNTTNLTTITRHTDNFGGAIDVSGYDRVGMQLRLVFANTSGLFVGEVAFKCYYDT